MKKKFITFMTAVAMISAVSANFTNVLADDIVTTQVEAAEVTQGYEMELGEVVVENDVKKVNIIVSYRGSEDCGGGLFKITFPKNLVTNATYKNFDEFASKVPVFTNEYISDGWLSYAFNGDGIVVSDKKIFTITLTVPADAAEFDVVGVDSYFENDDLDSFDGINSITVPGAKTVDPQEVTANLVHRHDEANATDKAVEYYMADFTPADSAFNKIKVTLTRKDNTTVEQSQDFAVVTGKASVFVQVLVTGLPKGEEDAVKSVVVTASVE